MDHGLRSPPLCLSPPTGISLVAPNDMFTKAIKRNLNLLYICANYSTILRKLDGRFQDPEVRRAFTVFQLMTILEENHHSFLIVEHDPLLYEDVGEMVEYLAQTLKQTSGEAAIRLHSPALDPHQQKMTDELADRVFCIYGDQAKGRKAEAKMSGAQATLEAYS